MRIAFLLLLLLPAASASADLYKWKDEQGNTVYGDNPPKHVKAERLTPPPLSTYPGSTAGAQKPAATVRPAEGKDDVLYRQLSIASPGHDEAIRSNSGEVTVQVRSDPPLDTAAGHKIRVYLNGRSMATQPASTFTLTEVERGTHLLYAEVLDNAGKSLRKSEIVQFHLLRYSALNK